jgi:hypothetical protein
MAIILRDIEAVRDSQSARWKVRALSVNNICPALSALSEWQECEPANYKSIINCLRHIVEAIRLPPGDKHVTKCANKKYPHTYEARANSFKARLMFFYSGDHVILTNGFWKTNDRRNQDAAFAECFRFKTFYESHK